MEMPRVKGVLATKEFAAAYSSKYSIAIGSTHPQGNSAKPEDRGLLSLRISWPEWNIILVCLAVTANFLMTRWLFIFHLALYNEVVQP